MYETAPTMYTHGTQYNKVALAHWFCKVFSYTHFDAYLHGMVPTMYKIGTYHVQNGTLDVHEWHLACTGMVPKIFKLACMLVVRM